MCFYYAYLQLIGGCILKTFTCHRLFHSIKIMLLETHDVLVTMYCVSRHAIQAFFRPIYEDFCRTYTIHNTQRRNIISDIK